MDQRGFGQSGRGAGPRRAPPSVIRPVSRFLDRCGFVFQYSSIPPPVLHNPQRRPSFGHSFGHHDRPLQPFGRQIHDDVELATMASWDSQASLVVATNLLIHRRPSWPRNARFNLASRFEFDRRQPSSARQAARKRRNRTAGRSDGSGRWPYLRPATRPGKWPRAHVSFALQRGDKAHQHRQFG